MESDMPFYTSPALLILTAFFLQLFVFYSAIAVASQLNQLEVTEIDCELGGVDAQARCDKADTWLLVTASGEPLPEYSAADTTSPPPYKDGVDLDIFVVELESDDEE
jgi:hypothetical protein